MNTTIENNKIIAEFMNWQKFNKFSMIAPKSGDDVWNFEDMKFNSNWNWLMEVVEKISKLNNFIYPDGIFKYLVDFNISLGNNCVTITDTYFKNCSNEKYIETIEFYEGTLIENTYNACLAFIEWYNEQNK